jgi:hypothetical protein
MTLFVACSSCFKDEGLRLTAERVGIEASGPCSNCHSEVGRKLGLNHLDGVAYRFFVWGTLHRTTYGAAPIVQYNDRRTGSSIGGSPWLQADIKIFERFLGIGFFHYGPRLWMVGEVEPLKALQDPATRQTIINRVLNEYPEVTLSAGSRFYRLRKAVAQPAEALEYDSPPDQYCGGGRFDAAGSPVMYGSQDLQICLHECRVTAEDDLFTATLSPMKALRLLDLTAVLQEDHVTEFESLDIAMHMLFLAGKHSYEITRALAKSAKAAGFDGFIYPSFFSFLRTGHQPFETVLGMSYRFIASVPDYADVATYERSKTIANLALFGRPIADGRVAVRHINRTMLNRVEYSFHFGPVDV